MDWSVFWWFLVGLPLFVGACMLIVTGMSHLIAKITNDERVGFAIIFGLFLVGMAVLAGVFI